jgi:hypothetical protein
MMERIGSLCLRPAVWTVAIVLWLGCCPYAALAAGFYDQPPIAEHELRQFIAELPAFRDWAHANGELAHPGLDDEGRPGFVYSAKTAARVEAMGWKPERFFCLMGRIAAAMAIQEMGNPGLNRPVDMPYVSAAEARLVRRHFDALVRAGDADTRN